ncbi:MAG: thioredoxin family protein [Candidatus Saganbacteria bacterium]|nr:thioredoxin family protein [Candidatus Saganbacteria bacterium]
MRNKTRFILVSGVFILLLIMSSIPAESAKKAVKPKNNIKITFLEIGSVNCIPCKMMQPVMKEIEEKYKGEVIVIFYDIKKPMGSYAAEKYGVNMIPTQVFMDNKGKEFFRHTGFYPASEIAKIIDKKLGQNAGNI